MNMTKGFHSLQYEQKEEEQVAYFKEYTLMYKKIKNLLLNCVYIIIQPQRVSLNFPFFP